MDLLLEASRQELIDKSKNANTVRSYGTTRWDRRNNVSVITTDRNFNTIDFNSLFKADLLNMILPIRGETNDYSVEILFEGICSKLKDELQRNDFRIEYKVVYRAIVNAINDGDILVSCSCDDWKYRQSYQSTMGRYNAGKPELRPAKITNPNDTEGAGCKHVLNVLGNLNWAMKLAICINNYILYIKDHKPELFENIIWPAISGMSYEQGEQEGYFGDLANTMDPNDSEGRRDIEAANAQEPEDFDDEYEEPVKDPGKLALQNYYENHTREETAKYFNIDENDLAGLLDKYDIKKYEVDN